MKRMTFEELEEIIQKIEKEEKSLSRLHDFHLDIILGKYNIFFDTEERKNDILQIVEDVIDDKIQNIKELKGV